MQRKATRQSRGPNAAEKRYQAWCKQGGCIVCGTLDSPKPGPSIVHHCEGATFKYNKVLVGHWFCIPLCQEHDDVVTHQSRKVFREMFGSQSGLWDLSMMFYMLDKEIDAPADVRAAIRDWAK